MKYSILFFILGVLACQSSGKQEAAEFFKRANYHVSKNDFEKADGFYSEAIEKIPDFADAYLNRGILREKMGKLDAADADFAKALELDPSFELARLQYAGFLSRLGQYQKSQNYLEPLPSTYQDTLLYQYIQGKNAAGLNKSDQAITWFSKAEQQAPRMPELATDMGFVYFQDKKYPEAKRYFEKAIQLDPNFAMAHHNLSVVFALEKKWDQAFSHSAKATQLDPKEAMFWTNHAYHGFLLENREESEKAFEKASKLEQDSNPYWLRLQGVRALSENRTPEALLFFEKAERIDPGTELIYYWLGKAEEKKGNLARSCQYFSKGFQLKDQWSTLCR